MRPMLRWGVLALFACACRADQPRATTLDATAEVAIDVSADRIPDSDFRDAEAGPFENTAWVLYHVDGDTLVVEFGGQDVRIRVLGIDTPEIYPKAEPFGKEASAFTRSSTPKDESIGLEFDDAACAQVNSPNHCWDQYDRLLAYIRLVDQSDLGAMLLTRGLARVYWDDFGRSSAYEALQTQAMKDGAGLWEDP